MTRLKTDYQLGKCDNEVRDCLSIRLVMTRLETAYQLGKCDDEVRDCLSIRQL